MAVRDRAGGAAEGGARPACAPDVLILACGVVAAVHVGKLPPALPALRESLAIGLVQAGFLVSVVQGAAMTLALLLGLWADRFGLQRALLGGALLLAAASMLGAAAMGPVWLLAWRCVEGVGFLLVSVSAPALIRRVVAPQRLNLSLGLWGTYMPAGTATALMLGPLVTQAFGWRAWWAGLGAAAALVAWLAWRGLRGHLPAVETHTRLGPAASKSGNLTARRPCPGGSAESARPTEQAGSPDLAGVSTWLRLRMVLEQRGPWLVSLTFAAYSSQWLAVIAFLPTIYTDAGWPVWQVGLLSGLVALVNVIGNIGAGRLLHRGVPALRLLHTGFAAMAIGSILAFGGQDLLPAWLRYGGVLAFSALGGLIPATLFSLAVRVAPREHSVPVVMGLMIQWSAFGQFVGPPLVAAWAAQLGDWSRTWIATGAAATAGALLAWRLTTWLRSRPGGR
jgi:CP family cyanate transporter-like MFS transporter